MYFIGKIVTIISQFNVYDIYYRFHYDSLQVYYLIYKILIKLRKPQYMFLAAKKIES